MSKKHRDTHRTVNRLRLALRRHTYLLFSPPLRGGALSFYFLDRAEGVKSHHLPESQLLSPYSLRFPWLTRILVCVAARRRIKESDN
jgi:hypothetical protein